MEYELLNPISIQALEEAGACERELHRFCYWLHKLYPGERHGYMDDFYVPVALKIASHCEGGVQFLLDKNFIKEKEPELLPCPYCGSSNIVNGGFYHMYCLVCNMSGPAKPTTAEAREAWNALPRR